MFKVGSITVIVLLQCIILGCKWNDDFRERVQPAYLENPPKPTLNPDSDQYVGEKVADRIQGKQPKEETHIKEIDERYVIPEVPENPTGVQQ